VCVDIKGVHYRDPPSSLYDDIMRHAEQYQADQAFLHPEHVQEPEDVFESNEEKTPWLPIHKAHFGGHLDHMYRVPGISLFEKLVL
jgi:hypothetical protein